MESNNFQNVFYKNINEKKINYKEIEKNFIVDEVFKEIPQELFLIDNVKSILSFLFTVFLYSFSIVLVLKYSIYFLPISWFLISTCFISIMINRNECFHNIFLYGKLKNNIFMILFSLLILYPIKNNQYSNIIRYRKNHKLFDSFYIWYQNSKNILKYYLVLHSIIIYYIKFTNYLNFFIIPWLFHHVLISFFILFPNNQKEIKNLTIFLPKWFHYLFKDLLLATTFKFNYLIPHYNYRKLNDLLIEKDWNIYVNQINLKEYLNFYLNDNNSKFNSLKNDIILSKKFDNEIYSIIEKNNLNFNFFKLIKGYFKEINWVHFIILVIIPIIGIISSQFIALNLNTFILSIVFYFLYGFGITAGYHRLFSHKAYNVIEPLKIILLLFGSGSIEGSCYWWCRDHRCHHKFIDSDKDPYGAQNGFWWSHFGWMIMKKKIKKGKVNMDDLLNDKWVMLQHKYYFPISMVMSYIIPTLIAGTGWGDWYGGIVYSGIFKTITIQHTTFFVNSLAHYLGDFTFDDKNTPKDSVITALLTLGEGYHNFHHEFPNDYRNAIRFYQYDPTKWLINLFYYLGLAYDLKTFSKNEIEKGVLLMKEKKLNKEKRTIYWGIENEQLPEMNQNEFNRLVKEEKRKLTIINNNVLDIESFINEHPGGVTLIKSSIGIDSTKLFKYEIYNHSNAANNLLCQFIIAKIKK